MLFQANWGEYVSFGIIFGVSCLIDLIVTKVMRRRQRQLQQRATAMARSVPISPEPTQAEGTLRQDEELGKWEDIVLKSTDPREKVIAISQIGLIGNVDDIDFLNEHANTDPTPEVQIAIRRAITVLQARIGQKN